MKFTYERDSNFQTFPLLPLACTHRIDLTKFPGLPDFDPTMLVHGEEHITIHGQIKCDQTYETNEEIIDLLDKGKNGSVLLMR